MATALDLLDTIPQPIQLVEPSSGSALKLLRIAIDAIYIPAQARKFFDEEFITRLAEAMHDKGQTWPVKVRRSATPGFWDLVAGEQRLRAATQAGLAEVWALEVEGEFTEADNLEHQLQENGLRTSLRPCEEAGAMLRLKQLRGYKTNTQLAQALRFPNSHVSRRLKLLKSYSPEQRACIDAGDVAEMVAVEIAMLDDKQDRLALFEQAKKGKWTKERAIAEVSALTKRRASPSSPSRPLRRIAWRQGAQPGGPGVAVTAADNDTQFDIDEIIAILTRALKHLKDAQRLGILVTQLPAFFRDPDAFRNPDGDNGKAESKRRKSTRNGEASVPSPTVTDDGDATVFHRAKTHPDELLED